MSIKRKSVSSWAKAPAVIAVAALMSFLFLTGAEIDGAGSRQELIAAIWNHVGFGAIAAPLLVFYVIWRLMVPVTRMESGGWRGRAESFALWAMVSCILFLVLTGPLVVWTYGSPLKVFDWFVISNPIGAQPSIHQWLEDAHVLVAQLSPIIILADAFMTLWLALGKTPS